MLEKLTRDDPSGSFNNSDSLNNQLLSSPPAQNQQLIGSESVGSLLGNNLHPNASLKNEGLDGRKSSVKHNPVGLLGGSSSKTSVKALQSPNFNPKAFRK